MLRLCFLVALLWLFLLLDALEKLLLLEYNDEEYEEEEEGVATGVK